MAVSRWWRTVNRCRFDLCATPDGSSSETNGTIVRSRMIWAYSTPIITFVESLSGLWAEKHVRDGEETFEKKLSKQMHCGTRHRRRLCYGLMQSRTSCSYLTHGDLIRYRRAFAQLDLWLNLEYDEAEV